MNRSAVIGSDRAGSYSATTAGRIDDTRTLDIGREEVRVAVKHTRAEKALRTNEKRMRGQNEAFQAAIHGAPREDSLGILAGIVTEETAGEARTTFYIADPDVTCLHPIRGAETCPNPT